ncbi:MAG: enoyl-CoA hydratase/isomerase family protein [Myxococcota bacterium]
MEPFGRFGDVHVSLGDDAVALAEIRRPPNNFFDRPLIAALADAFEALDAEAGCRAIVLASEGRHFCAGADFSGRTGPVEDDTGRHLYDEAVRLFATRTPVVAAIQGAAVGGGLGLALMPDFRVACAEARFSANFARLGFHHGFGLSVTLPRLVGPQAAAELLYTGLRVKGDEAFDIGLCDRLVDQSDVRPEALALAHEIALSAPLAIASIRETLRGDLAAAIRVATDREKAEQDRLQKTEDFREGTRAMAERRTPDFRGR